MLNFAPDLSKLLVIITIDIARLIVKFLARFWLIVKFRAGFRVRVSQGFLGFLGVRPKFGCVRKVTWGTYTVLLVVEKCMLVNPRKSAYTCRGGRKKG